MARSPLRSETAGSHALPARDRLHRVRNHRGHPVAHRRIAVAPRNRGIRQHRRYAVSAIARQGGPSPRSSPPRPRSSSPRCIVSELRTAASSSPSSPRATALRDELPPQPPTAPSRQIPDPGGSPASIPCRHRVPGAKSTRASNSRLSDGRIFHRWRRSARRSRRRFRPGRSPSGAPSVSARLRSHPRPPPAARLQASAAAGDWQPNAASMPSRPSASCRRAARREATASLHKACSE